MKSSPLHLYELAGADDAWRFSPYCWRVRLALAHKQLNVETIPWRFIEKEKIAFSGQSKVPILMDGDRCVSDSWAIAEYLESQYPEQPSLFGEASAKSLTRFFNQWITEVIHPALARVILPDLFHILHGKDKEYFRRTREAMFGQSLESLAEGSDEALVVLRNLLKPLRSTLLTQHYLAGVTPAYADYIAFGAFQWARVSSPRIILDEADPIADWCERMLAAYGGLARATPCAHASPKAEWTQ